MRNRTVCPTAYGQDDRKIPFSKQRRQYCREELRRTCFQIPFLRPHRRMVKTYHPEQKPGDCLKVAAEKPPRVECQRKMEKVCFSQLELVDDREHLRLKNCSLTFRKGRSSCQMVKFEVPKTLCKQRPLPFH